MGVKMSVRTEAEHGPILTMYYCVLLQYYCALPYCWYEFSYSK